MSSLRRLRILTVFAYAILPGLLFGCPRGQTSKTPSTPVAAPEKQPASQQPAGNAPQQKTNGNGTKAPPAKEEPLPDESKLQYYLVVRSDGNWEAIRGKDAASASAKDVNYFNTGDCLITYPETETGDGGPWVRVFTPDTDQQFWVSLKYVEPSDECREALVLAEDLFLQMRGYIMDVLIPYKQNKRSSFGGFHEIPLSDNIVQWIKDHSSKTYAVYSTYDNDADDFCRTAMYCGPWHQEFNDQTLQSRIFDLQENLSYFQVDISRLENDESGKFLKYSIFALMKIGYENSRAIFFHYPGAAHNVAWHFSKQNDLWIIDTVYVNTD